MAQRRSPIVLPKPEYRRADRLAEECIARCMAVQGLARVPLPIPVEHWIEGPLRIRLDITDLSHLGEGVLGAAFVKSREILISQALVGQEARYRFTCAHELGHIVMHSNAKSPFYDADTSLDEVRRTEAQANRFAGSFLMPLAAYIEGIFEAVQSAGRDRIDGLTVLLQDLPESCRFWDACVLPHLCGRFAVSRRAALYRACSLRLRDRRPLVLPAVRRSLESQQKPH